MAESDKSKEEWKQEAAELSAERDLLRLRIATLEQDARDLKHGSAAYLLATEDGLAHQIGDQAGEQMEQFKLEVDNRLKALVNTRLSAERILARIPVGLAYLDKDLVCRWADPTFTQLLKRTRGQVINCPLGKTLPEAEAAMAELLRVFAASGKTETRSTTPLVRSFEDNETFWDLMAMPMLSEEGEVEGILVAVEVTERVETETAQRKEIARLGRLLEVKGDLLSTVSHELRSPLTTIAGYVEFLEDDVAGALTDEQRSFVTEIQAAEARIRHIVDDLLDLAQLEAGQVKLRPALLDLAELVREVLKSLLPQSNEANIQASLEAPTKRVLVNVDRQRTEQVLLNLVGNAIKFTPAGGTIVVTLVVGSRYVRVSVIDSGPGIARPELPRIFERFFQAEHDHPPERLGAGLGLAIAKTLVEVQGGEIGVTSEVGVGSTFWFTIPLTLQPPAPEAK